ncbi:uncharacterized protein PAF06_013909 [Gastrophryne carolinensis]
MATLLFEGKEHASYYQKYRFSAPQELMDMIYSYVGERLAVDVGCGTGQSTRILSPHFESVLGTDISAAQIGEAKNDRGFPNVTYKWFKKVPESFKYDGVLVTTGCRKESMYSPNLLVSDPIPLTIGLPGGDFKSFRTSSLKTLTAPPVVCGLKVELFLHVLCLKEVGCMDEDGSSSLTEFGPVSPPSFLGVAQIGLLNSPLIWDISIILAAISQGQLQDILSPYEHERIRHIRTGYKEIYDAIPYTDKKRIEGVVSKIPMPLATLMGLIQTFSMFQTYLSAEPERAKQIIRRTEERFLDIMGASSDKAEVELWLYNVMGEDLCDTPQGASVEESSRDSGHRRRQVGYAMATQLFEGKEHASYYQKYRFSAPQELMDMIYSYVGERLPKPHKLAVDVGCGTGQSTRILSPHFENVLGTDISAAQIEEAKNARGFPNVTYKACPAEEVPVPDASVDLLTACTAVHWFEIEKFLKEVDRVLKPHGCLALYSYLPDMEVHYKDCSDEMTKVFEEVQDCLEPYQHEKVYHVKTSYKDIFEMIPYSDKKRILNLTTKMPMPVAAVLGLIQTFSAFQSYQRAEPEKAKEVIRTAEKRFKEIMGVSSTETEVELRLHNVLVLASKPE